MHQVFLDVSHEEQTERSFAIGWIFYDDLVEEIQRLNHNPFGAPDHQARRLVPVVGIGSRN